MCQTLSIFDEDKIGAEIPFTRYFYKYEAPKPSEELEKEFIELEKFVNKRVSKLFKEAWWRRRWKIARLSGLVKYR